ncbi:MAG: DUF4238 domain-containing protein [Coriobacteriia bacterium]|nr:DUF4238 domain-containing protein [Coriobacteriia bacterium]
MEIKQNQHQLHRGYARAYSETYEDTDLVFYDVHGNRQPLQSTRSLTVEPNLYESRDTKKNQIENWFSSNEKMWSDSLRAARETKSLAPHDYCNLIDFAMLTALRQKETIAIYHGIYECFGEANGKDIFMQSFNTARDRLRENWLKASPTMAVVSLEEDESSCFYLTSDNPVLFFDESHKYQPLWTVPMETYRGFFFPVSGTRLFISFLGDDLPELLGKNNTLQRYQARETIFCDRSKVSILISECQEPIYEPFPGIDMYRLTQYIVKRDQMRTPVDGIIVTEGSEISIVPNCGPQIAKVIQVYPGVYEEIDLRWLE